MATWLHRRARGLLDTYVHGRTVEPDEAVEPDEDVEPDEEEERPR